MRRMIAFARIVASPEIQERILAQASEPVGNGPEEYAAFINEEIIKWRAVMTRSDQAGQHVSGVTGLPNSVGHCGPGLRLATG